MNRKKDGIYLSILLLCACGCYCVENRSLTFVIDDTGSMSDDIRQVVSAANDIFDTVMNSKTSQIEDFVLVTFNDLTGDLNNQFHRGTDLDIQSKLRTVTTKKETLKDELSRISVDGGVDCTEFALTGIMKGIENSRPGSTIFVFTDASAKDYSLVEDVHSMAAGKQIQIVFILTGSCLGQSGVHPDTHSVYYKLAKDTSGQVFNLGKQDVNQILMYVRENMKSRKTVLIDRHLPPGPNALPFYMDSGMSNFVFSITGSDISLTVKGPDGRSVETNEIIKLANILIATIPYNGGPNEANITSTSETTVRGEFDSSYKFQHGFSIFKPSHMDDTTTRPLPDVKSFITIQLTEGDLDLKTVKFVDVDGTFIKEVLLTVLDKKEKLYRTELVDLPKTTFRLKIKGYDNVNDEEIERMGSPIIHQLLTPSAAIHRGPRKETRPQVTITDAPSIGAEWRKPVKLTCKILAYPTPDIIWVNHKTNEMLPGDVSLIEFPDKFVSILNIDKIEETTSYSCSASNAAGQSTSSIRVKIITRPYIKVNEKPKDTYVLFNEDGELRCKAEAYPSATISWYKNRKPLQKSKRISLTEENSVLRITHMRPDDDGDYTCEIKNGRLRKLLKAQVATAGADAPKLDKTVDTITALAGSDVTIKCTIIKGFPIPEITWYYQDNFSGEELELDEWSMQNTISLNNVRKDSGGSFRCFAKNFIGNDNHIFSLKIEYPPEIKGDLNQHVRASVGQPVDILCDVDGIPEPAVTWYKDNVLLRSGMKRPYYGKYYLGLTAKASDRGTYTCNATNHHGTIGKVVKLDVNVPVKISVPEDTKINLEVGDSANLLCQAKGDPTPRTEWTYYSFAGVRVDTKPLRKPDSDLHLRIMRQEDEGYYVCTASNSDGSTNLTYEIHVQTPPQIVDKTDMELTAVEGDRVLQIDCKVTGNPTPDIAWLWNSYPVATGDAISITGGTLILRNIMKNHEGNYECKAENSLGVDSVSYDVKVEKVPSPGPPTSTVEVRDGSAVNVTCNVPHIGTDLLRWYKNGELIRKGELTLENATASDGGIYTCRVSDFVASSDGNILVKVKSRGVKPRFIREEEENIDFVDGNSHELSCEATGEPNPEITWHHNGNLMNVTESMYFFTMDVNSLGKYDCEVSNENGRITRTFKIRLDDCYIDIKKRSPKQPLLLSKSITWPSNIENGFVPLPKNDYVILICPRRFNTFKYVKQFVQAYCVQGSRIKIFGKEYEYSELECNEEMSHSIKKSTKRCGPGNTEFREVRFNERTRLPSVEAYKVCLDLSRNEPLYTQVRMSKNIADVDHLDTTWTDDGISFGDEAYDCNQQNKVTSNILGTPFHRTDGCCFTKRQLVSHRDLIPGVAQKAAYSQLNVVPHWSTCNADSGNWDEVENRVRKLAKTSYNDVVVSTGTADHLTLPDYTGSGKSITLKDNMGHRQNVPKYLWKVVQVPATKSSLVIIQLNVPDLTHREAAALTRCSDICARTAWMNGTRWHDVDKGFTYCCSLDEFEIAFGYRYVFEPLYRILNDVSALPDTILAV